MNWKPTGLSPTSPIRKIEEGSLWFRRFIKETQKISRHIRFKKIKYGFYRIYWRSAYVHEVYKEMPQKGYDLDSLDPRFESQKYYEEYEDRAEITRKIKNYVEGYFDSTDRMRSRCYMMRNDMEYNQNASNAYKQMRIV